MSRLKWLGSFVVTFFAAMALLTTPALSDPPGWDDEYEPPPHVETVVIVGELIYVVHDYFLEWWYYYIPSPSPELVDAINVNAFRGDVRCGAPGIAPALKTSKVGEGYRWEAANATIIAMIADLRPNQRNALVDRQFKVTYSDGGTEHWVIKSPASATYVLDETPVPNTLVEGDGVPVPNPTCVT